MKTRNLGKYRYLICFGVLAALCWMFPYTGDDWAWGSSIGIERLENWFDNYSGRYVGNLIVLALTRSNVLKTLAMACCLTGILYCIEKLVKERWAFEIGCFLMVCLPRAVFRQAVVWTAGFANYVTSIFFTLIYLVVVWKIFEEAEARKLRQNVWQGVLLFGLGVVNTLIVEHLTLYNVVLGLFVLIFVFVKYRKVYIQHVLYAVGTICGTCYMFSNSVYHSISESADGYRSVAQGGVIAQALNSYLHVIYEEFYMNNLVLNLALLAACALLYRKLKENLANDRQKKVMELCLWIMLVYAVYACLSVVGLGEAAKRDALMWMEGIATLAGGCAVIVFVILAALQCGRLWKLLFLIGSILCMAAPLFVVNPIGSRCFFATYVMFVLLVCEVCSMLKAQGETADVWASVKKCAAAASIAGMVFYLSIFSSISRADQARLERILKQAAKGKTKIEILHLPYEAYLWTPTPNAGEVWEERYKLFYGVPEEVTLKAVWEYSK